MDTIAVFGGSFNPIHNGHINMIIEIDKKFNFNKIIIMPTNIPPHKSADEFIDDIHRLNMCKLSFDNKKIEVSDYEIKKGGISYTVDTLKYLKDRYKDEKIFFIMGSDMLLCFHKWKDYKTILNLATLIVCARCDEDKILIENYIKERSFSSEIILFPIKPYKISSTEIRGIIRNNLDFTCYLPKRVVKYISENNLYK